jgi:hypothetical protein
MIPMTIEESEDMSRVINDTDEPLKWLHANTGKDAPVWQRVVVHLLVLQSTAILKIATFCVRQSL